jgi:formamidopyrimidine-DNA glycosylase
MPELPDVDVARTAAARVAVGRRIARVRCADDPLVFEGVSPARFRRALHGRQVRAVHRRGKHMWFELDRRPWPAFHFGMTGGIHLPGTPEAKLVSSATRNRGGAWPPPFTKIHFTFDDGGELVIADARRLGRIRLRHDPRNEPPISLLGFDALLELPPPRRFVELLQGRSAAIKAVLLDQSFAAGVGNWIADEVLFQARIDPRRPARSLSRDEAVRVRAALKRVVTAAVEAGSDSDRYPRTWLFHTRWERGPAAVTARGQWIRHDTIGGRTAAWVPAVQR